MYYFITVVISIWIFIKTISYGIYEIKKNSNKSGGIAVIALSILSLILPIIMVIYRGIH